MGKSSQAVAGQHPDLGAATTSQTRRAGLGAVVEAIGSAEFLTGLRWGGIASAVGLIVGLAWRRWRNRPAPVAGLAAVVAVIMAMPIVRFDNDLLAGLALLAVAGAIFRWTRRVPLLPALVALPGAWLIARSDLPGTGLGDSGARRCHGCRRTGDLMVRPEGSRISPSDDVGGDLGRRSLGDRSRHRGGPRAVGSLGGSHVARAGHCESRCLVRSARMRWSASTCGWWFGVGGDGKVRSSARRRRSGCWWRLPSPPGWRTANGLLTTGWDGFLLTVVHVALVAFVTRVAGFEPEPRSALVLAVPAVAAVGLLWWAVERQGPGSDRIA